MLTRNATPRAGRGGFTLIELLIAMALMGIVGGAIVTLLLRQQRFYNSTNVLIDARQQIRQAAAMLPADLRGISSRGGDIYAMTDSSIDFRSVFGSSVICAISVGGKTVTTVPLTLAKSSSLTNWAVPPTAGDSVALFNDSSDVGTPLDTWQFFQIVSNTGVAGACPALGGLVQASDLLIPGNVAYQVLLLTAPSKNIQVGSPIRFFRHVHYSLYKPAGDSLWYLGYKSCPPAGCNPIQPIGGPFRAYAAPASGTSGLQFTYYDSTGAVTATRLNVARISLAVRAQGASTVNFSGGGSSTFQDSLRMEIDLRNRK